MGMKKIVLIGVYFGKLPKWINLYLETCRWNPTVDWIIFTDNPMPASGPAENVEFVKMTIPGFCSLAGRKLNLKVRIENPYKLCDFKPAFGVIFNEYLSGYDFWSAVELDALWGDIRAFMTDGILNRYQLISAMPRYVCGNFTLYKNQEELNNLYRQNPRFGEVFEDGGRFYNFEERMITETVAAAAKENRLRFLAEQWVVSAGLIEDFFRDVPAGEMKKMRRGAADWRSGKMFHAATDEEKMYAHFDLWKSRWCFLRDVRLRGRIDRIEIRKEGLRVYGPSRLVNALYLIEHWFGRLLLPFKPVFKIAGAVIRPGKKIRSSF